MVPNHFILKAAVVSMAGTFLGGLIAQAMPHTTLSGDWLVDLRTVCAVGGIVLTGSWQISRWQTKVTDRLDLLESTIAKLPCVKDQKTRCDEKKL